MQEAGYDPARLPPGPVPDREVARAARRRRRAVPTDLATLGLPVSGEVEDAAHARRGSELQRAPATRGHAGHPLRHALEPVRHDLHRGRLARARASSSRPRPSARFAIAHAEQGFTANVPISFLERRATRSSRRTPTASRSTPEHGWPLRLVVPGKYFWKSAKWLRGIELLADDRPASGSGTATTTTPTPGRSSATGSDASGRSLVRVTNDDSEAADTWATHLPQYHPRQTAPQAPSFVGLSHEPPSAGGRPQALRARRRLRPRGRASRPRVAVFSSCSSLSARHPRRQLPYPSPGGDARGVYSRGGQEPNAVPSNEG